MRRVKITLAATSLLATAALFAPSPVRAADPIKIGITSVLGGPFAAAVAAVALGIGAVINYNATWGMVGAALGLWAWFRRALPPPGAAGEA